MGQPKALLKLGSQTFLERTVAELRRLFDDVIVMAAPESAVTYRLPNVAARVIFDFRPFEGPLSALAQGLGASRAEVVFACSCDLPFLRAELAAALCDWIETHDAAIPLVKGRFQPLVAAYRQRVGLVAQELVTNGERSLQALIAKLKIKVIGEEKLRKLDPELKAFWNVNTPEDYRAVLEHVETSKWLRRV